MGNAKTKPWRVKDLLSGTWKGLTLGTNNPWVAAGTGALGLGGLGYLLGPEAITRINPAMRRHSTQNLRNRGMAGGLLAGTMLAATPALLNWRGSRQRAAKGAKKTAGSTEFGRHYVPYGQAMQNIAEQDTLKPGFKFDFAKAVDSAADGDPTGLVPLSSIAYGLMGYGMGRAGSALGGALIGARPETQKTLNRIGGWAGAASAVPGLIDWSR